MAIPVEHDFSPYAALLPVIALIGAAAPFFFLKGRRLGYLATLSVIGILAVSAALVTSYYRWTLVCYADYRLGPDYVDNHLWEIRLDRGTLKFHRDISRNNQQIDRVYVTGIKVDGWRTEAEKFKKKRPFLYLVSSQDMNTFSLPLPPTWSVLADWRLRRPVLTGKEPTSVVAPVLDFFVVVRLWLLFIPLAIFPLWWMIRRIRRGKFGPGCCRKCGYDLRAHKSGAACPECGTVIPPRTAKASAETAAAISDPPAS